MKSGPTSPIHIKMKSSIKDQSFSADIINKKNHTAKYIAADSYEK